MTPYRGWRRNTSGRLVRLFHGLLIERVVRIRLVIIGIRYCFEIPILFFDSFEVFVQSLHESLHSLHCGESLGESFFNRHCDGL